MLARKLTKTSQFLYQFLINCIEFDVGGYSRGFRKNCHQKAT